MEEIYNQYSLQLIRSLLAIVGVIALWLTLKSKSTHKIEVFLLSFFLMSGHYNKLLTFKVPGISFFEIYPVRLLFLVFAFVLLRRFITPQRREQSSPSAGFPAFKLPLYLFVGAVILSQFSHLTELGLSEVLATSLDNLSFIIILTAIALIVDPPFRKTIGQAIIIGAVITSVIAVIQLGYDHYFMRYGDNRQAFGSVIRSNGAFREEYSHSYFLIVAIFWTLVSVKTRLLKIILVGLFMVGIICSFQRMSWVILALSLFIYGWKIDPPPAGQIVFAGLAGVSVLLLVSILYYRDIANSSVVQDRLMDNVDNRKGYWEMVMDHIGEKPFFGFGSKKNDIYYYYMMQITEDRDRATGATGDIHNGYLQSLFIYGIPAFVFFVLFVLFLVLYFVKLLPRDLFFTVPFMVALLYMIANLTNNFVFLKYVSILLAINTGIGLGTLRNLAAFQPQLPAKRPKKGLRKVEVGKIK